MTSPTPNTTIGIKEGFADFEDFSYAIGVMGGGEPIEKPAKVIRHGKFFGDHKRHNGLTKLVGNIGERFVQSLFPDSKIVGQHEHFDILFPHVDGDIKIEVKTAQRTNQGVIKEKQAQHFLDEHNKEDFYVTGVYYRTKSGAIPSKVPRDKFESQFWPLCIYIFPLSFIIYLINRVQPTGNQPGSSFYGLKHTRARLFFNQILDTPSMGYSATVLPLDYHGKAIPSKKKECHTVMVHVVDHMNHPVILDTLRKHKYILDEL